MQEPSPWIGIIGVVFTGWIAVTPLFAGTLMFYVKTKNAIAGLNIHLDYFKKKFSEIIADIKQLQAHHEEIAIELGPVKKNGSLVTSDQLDRRLVEINNRMKSVEAKVIGEIKLFRAAYEMQGRGDDAAHRFTEDQIREIVRIAKSG